MKADEVIKLFQLEPLAGEGGFFRRTYCSKQTALYEHDHRPIVSSIYYLVTPDNFSAFHKLKFDEIFHFYAGDACEFVRIINGKVDTVRFGNNIADGEQLQMVVKGDTWQALKISQPTVGWALMGTTVSPAFEYSDFEIGNREDLTKEFPNLKAVIHGFTREGRAK